MFDDGQPEIPANVDPLVVSYIVSQALQHSGYGSDVGPMTDITKTQEYMAEVKTKLENSLREATTAFSETGKWNGISYGFAESKYNESIKQRKENTAQKSLNSYTRQPSFSKVSTPKNFGPKR